MPVENDFSFSCAWLSERTPRAFDCPRLCAEGGGVPACPADEVEAEWLASELTTSSCATPDCSVANLLWLGVYRPGESNTRELWDSCMDGGEAYASYWIRRVAAAPSAAAGLDCRPIPDATTRVQLTHAPWRAAVDDSHAHR